MRLTLLDILRCPTCAAPLAVDVYPKFWKNIFFAKYWITPLTKRIDAAQALALARKLFPVVFLAGRIPVVGHYLRYLIPLVNYDGVYPFNRAQQREWALLDTFDMWSPTYDQPQAMAEVQRWYSGADFENVEVFHLGFFVGRGQKTGAR